MPPATEPVAPEVRPVTLDADGVPVSALLAEPVRMPARAVVVAVHGTGMRAGYFDSQAHPGHSLLRLGARLGYTVLAVDRPGYGASAAALPDGQGLAEQSATLRAALAHFCAGHPTGAGLFVVAHSYGGKLALRLAADAPADGLLGLDISGLGSRFAVDAGELPGAASKGAWRRHWGSLRLYPPDAFRLSRRLVAPVPVREAVQARLWPELYPTLAARVRVPVRFTFAEQEQWWRQDPEAVRLLVEPLTVTRARVVRQPHAGHNISLGWAARTYHLRALAFLEECLLYRETLPPPPRRGEAA